MMRWRRRALALLASAIVVVLTPPVSAQLSVPPTPAVPSVGRYLEESFTFSRTQVDVPYGQAVNSRGELQTLRLDVYEPDADPEAFRPAIVWLHGGFFVAGNKSGVGFLHELTRRGYVTISINYRIRPEMPPFNASFVNPEAPQNFQSLLEAVTDAQHDAQAAIRWVRANAADLRVDPARVMIAGHSAGGVTAFGAAFNPENDGNSGNPGWPSRVAAAISQSGGSAILLPPGSRPPMPGDAPILALHSIGDTTVPWPTSVAPCVLTLAVGNVCEMRWYPAASHGTPGDDSGATSASFLHRHVLSAPRVATRLVDVATSARGETVTVTGRLTTEHGDPIAAARILGRARAGWTETTSGPAGEFTLVIPAPDHGHSVDVELRYEGRYTDDSGLPVTPHALAPTPLAPTQTSVKATWGGGGPGS